MYSNEDFITLLRSEVKPALGCTEPMAVALAVARACKEIEALGDSVEHITVEVSRNILKNGMGVGIPGTDMVGLGVAAAVAMVCGRSDLGLEVLKDVCAKSVERAKEIMASGVIKISLSERDKMLYIKAICQGTRHVSEVVIEDKHDNVVSVVVDGKALINTSDTADSNPEKQSNGQAKKKSIKPNLRQIYNFVTSVGIDEIEFMRGAADMNLQIAHEGLNNKYGLQVGRTILNTMGGEVFGTALLSYSMALTAAASDARMAGCTRVVMSNSGSGNQGLTATLPVVAAAQKFGSTDEELIRALTLSHLVAIHIKQNLGRLSALCGCVVAATGSSCGIVLLKGGDFQHIGYAIKNMVANITGMVCDGAKIGCALKVASGVSAAVQAAMLALENISTTTNDGIIDDDIERTLKNLAIIGNEGMKFTDKVMLDIMTHKC